MTPLGRLLASTVLVATAGVCPAAAQMPGAAAGSASLLDTHSTTPAKRTGRLEGQVTDDRGRPLSGVAVSAEGQRLVFAVSDGRGHFTFDALGPGTYLVRAHRPGFSASSRILVEVLPSASAWQAFKLQRLELDASGAPPSSPVLAAGFGQGAPEDGGSTSSDTVSEGDDHGTLAWRLRHVKRSVLRDVAEGTDLDPDDAPEVGGSSLFGSEGAGLSASLSSALPLTGQVQFLATSSFDSPQQLFSLAQVPHNVAYVSISAPAGRNATWAVQGALTQGDLSSWVLGGSYVRRLSEHHSLDTGVSYAMQRYDGANPAALAAVREGDRDAGALFAFDRWSMSKTVSLTYGTRYARYGYVEGAGLLSPSLSLAWSPSRGARIRAAVSQQMIAPGADEFVPSPVAGLWLPPQRTFASLNPEQGFRPERTQHMEVVFERQIASYVFTASGFRQVTQDQIVTLFGVRVDDAPRSDLGHYFTTSAGDVSAYGWSVGISRPVASRMRGSVTYSLMHADWAEPGALAFYTRWAPSAVRGTERLQDLTTSLETDIPETATHVFAAYRINTGFARASLAEETPGLDARFDVQVSQRLPFMGFTSAQWEILVAVRNLFREGQDGASVYDELLVVRPPKRIVGGVLVRF